LTTVLILDDDPGFLFWLGALLGELGYKTFPALNVPEALVCAQKLKLEIDLLIVNPLQTGAADFINTLRRSKGTVKVLALSDHQTVDLPVVNASLGKPDQLDQNTGIRWRDAVERLLAAT
jgi:DNA-binding response OmpR family regulator